MARSLNVIGARWVLDAVRPHFFFSNQQEGARHYVAPNPLREFPA